MFSVSPRVYYRLTLIACFFIGAIIVTGAAVRVTGSGLGCDTWPKCTSGSFTPHDSGSYHAMIEFGNRLFTGLLSLSVIVTVAASVLRRPKSKLLILLSWALVAGIIAQIVLGGITVLVGLNPIAVASHMILSCVILSAAITLCVAAKDIQNFDIRSMFQFNRYALVSALSFLVVVLGAVVTAAGPHAGDQNVSRLKVSIETIARIHSLSAWLLLGTITFLILAKKDRSKSIRALFALVIIQGIWGYTQYALSVPAWMVIVHVLLAACVYAVANLYWISQSQTSESISKN